MEIFVVTNSKVSVLITGLCRWRHQSSDSNSIAYLQSFHVFIAKTSILEIYNLSRNVMQIKKLILNQYLLR